MLFKVNSLFMVLVAVWLFAVVGCATDVVDHFGVALEEESVVVLPDGHDAFAYAKYDLVPRDVTIIKTICETETSVASTFTTVPVPTVVTETTLLSTGISTSVPTGVATGKPPVASETTTAPTTGPVVTSQPPVTSKTEGTPGTTVQPPSSSGTPSAPTTETEDTTSSVSSGEQTSNHTVSTHTTVSAGTTAPTSTHTPSPSPTKNVAGGHNGMHAALLAFAAAHLGFFML